MFKKIIINNCGRGWGYYLLNNTPLSKRGVL